MHAARGDFRIYSQLEIRLAARRRYKIGSSHQSQQRDGQLYDVSTRSVSEIPAGDHFVLRTRDHLCRALR